jgi:hypothetical protein
LKTFLTQFEPALPLTPDPPVRLHDDQKGGTAIEIAIWRAFLPKMLWFRYLTSLYPPICTRIGPPAIQPYPAPRSEKNDSSLFFTTHPTESHPGNPDSFVPCRASSSLSSYASPDCRWPPPLPLALPRARFF